MVLYRARYLIVAGSANTVNLTDGLDGLAAGTVAIALLAYVGITWLNGYKDLAILAASLMVAASAFCGTTRSPPRCSWATPGRWLWVRPWEAWPS